MQNSIWELLFFRHFSIQDDPWPFLWNPGCQRWGISLGGPAAAPRWCPLRQVGEALHLSSILHDTLHTYARCIHCPIPLSMGSENNKEPHTRGKGFSIVERAPTSHGFFLTIFRYWYLQFGKHTNSNKHRKTSAGGLRAEDHGQGNSEQKPRKVLFRNVCRSYFS